MQTQEIMWEVDHKETDSGSGRYDYYFIMNEDGKVVCDTSNSDVQEIHTEDDENGIYSWDEQGKKDLTRLVECRNALAGVPDPADLIETIEEVVESWLDESERRHANSMARLQRMVADMKSARGTKGVGK